MSSKKDVTWESGLDIQPVYTADDVEASGKELEARGMTVLMRDPVDADGSPRWLVHPKDANGVMVEAIAGGLG